MKQIALLLVALVLAACGGGGGGPSGTVPAATPPGTQPATTPVQINLGDDPADRLVATSVTVNSVALLKQDGSSVMVMSTPRPMEMMRLMGTVAPLALAGVPQGSYTGATLTFGSSTVTYIDSVTGLPVQRAVPGPMTTTVMFGSPLVVGTTPMVVNLDMNMAASVGIDAAGNVSLTPSMSAHHNAAVAGSRDPEDGGMHGLNGMVSTAGSNSFNVDHDAGHAGCLAHDPLRNALRRHRWHAHDGQQPVAVDRRQHAAGRQLAGHARSRTRRSGGAMAAGVVTSLTGAPPTQLVLVMHDGTGSGMMASNLAGTTTVNVGDATVFSIDARDVDLANLPFTPQFDRASVSRGQRIESFSAGQMMQGGGMHGMMGAARSPRRPSTSDSRDCAAPCRVTRRRVRSRPSPLRCPPTPPSRS